MMLQLPSSSISKFSLARLYSTPATKTVSVSPSSNVAVPAISGVELLVVNGLTVGAGGAVRSMVTSFIVASTASSPLALITVATTSCGPSGRGAAGVRLQLPSALIVKLPLATL